MPPGGPPASCSCAGRCELLLLKTLIFTILVPGTVALVVPFLLWSRFGQVLEFDAGAARTLGLAPIAAGVGIYLWCAADFLRAQGTPAPMYPTRELVVRGLYRYVRNPMYVGIFGLLLGGALFLGAGVLFIYAAGVFLGFNLFVFLYEEPTLRKQFGESYRQYCRTVRRWLPGPPKDPRRALAKEETRALTRR